MDYENDIQLTRNLSAESANRSSFLKSLTTRNILFGSAAVAAAVGLGLAACIWAYNQGLDPKLLEAALAKMPALKVEPVKIDPTANDVEIADGETVKLVADPLTGVLTLNADPLTLAPGQSVTLDAETLATILENQRPVAPNVIPPTTTPNQPPDKTKDGDAIKREVVAFTLVNHGAGVVWTGWKYKDGAGKTPIQQYCYYEFPTIDGKDQKITIQIDGRLNHNASGVIPNFAQARNKCVWFNGSNSGPNKKRAS